MRLVDHGLRPGPAGILAIRNARQGRGHQAFRHGGRAVQVAEAQVLVLARRIVSQLGVGHEQRAIQSLGVGIQQQLVGIEAMAGFGRIGARGTQGVTAAGPEVGKIAMPDSAALLREREAPGLAARFVEKAEVDLAGLLREDGQVGSLAVPGDAQRRGTAGSPGAHGWTNPRKRAA